MTENATMTLNDVRARLRRAQAVLGDGGRFSLTLHQPRQGECSILHWFRADRGSGEDCREIGHGTIAECLAALDRYVDPGRRD